MDGPTYSLSEPTQKWSMKPLSEIEIHNFVLRRGRGSGKGEGVGEGKGGTNSKLNDPEKKFHRRDVD